MSEETQNEEVTVEEIEQPTEEAPVEELPQPDPKALAVQAENIVLLIEKYLEDKAELRHETDSLNICNNQIVSWGYKNIPQPTLEQLFDLIEPAKNVELIKKQSKEALKFLSDTDWQVLRHRDQQELGIATSLTAQEFQDLLQERQMAREAVTK